MVMFRDLSAMAARRSAFTKFIRQWIKHVWHCIRSASDDIVLESG